MNEMCDAATGLPRDPIYGGIARRTDGSGIRRERYGNQTRWGPPEASHRASPAETSTPNSAARPWRPTRAADEGRLERKISRIRRIGLIGRVKAAARAPR